MLEAFHDYASGAFASQLPRSCRAAQKLLRFRIEAGFWILLVAAMTLAGLLYALGLIGRRPA